MAYSVILLKQVIKMFLIASVGVVCSKTGLIAKEAEKSFSAFVLNIVTPAYIFSAYQSEFSKESLKGLLAALILAVLSHIIMIILSNIFIRKNPKNEYAIERFSSVYSNCGYMGIPLIEGIFGTEGVFFATAYITVFNIFTWTHGIMTIKNSFSPKDILSALTSPTLIAIAVGLILYVTNIRLPEVINTPISYIGSMNTPLAMTVAGFTIAGADILKTLKKLRTLYIILLRLVIFPFIVISVLRFFPCDEVVFMCSMLAVCCPAAAVGTLFAVRYDKNAVYASELFALSTILCAVSMPLMFLYIGFVR